MPMIWLRLMMDILYLLRLGARWKADVSRGIDIRLAGLLSDNSNLGTVLNTVITGEVNKIKAAGTIKGAITNILFLHPERFIQLILPYSFHHLCV